MWWMQRHLFQNTEPIDGFEVNGEFREVVSFMEGHLGEHNWQVNAMTLRSQMVPGAVFRIYQLFTNVDPDLEIVPPSGAPPAGPVASFRVPNTESWTPISGLVNSVVDTGNSKLWIMASFQEQQQGRQGLDSGTAFAVRLDGQIMPESVTGSWEESNDARGKGMGLMNTAAGPANSGGAYGLVVEASMDVTPGRHTVEIVVKLPEAVNGAVPVTGTDFFEIFNRELIVIVFDPADTDVAGAGVSWTPIAEGDVVNAASLNTPFANVRTEINDLDYTAVKAESLTAQHLPSPVVAVGSNFQGGNAVLHTYANAYVTYDSALGWVVVTSNGVPMTATVAADLDDTTIRGILVLVNVEIRDIEPAGATPQSPAQYAVFAIQATVDGGATWQTIQRTERYVNSESTVGINVLVQRDLAIRTLIVQGDLTAGNRTVDQVRLVVAVVDRSGLPSAPQVILDGVGITAVALQASA